MGTQQMEQRHQGGQGIRALQTEDTEVGAQGVPEGTVIQCVVQQGGWALGQGWTRALATQCRPQQTPPAI